MVADGDDEADHSNVSNVVLNNRLLVGFHQVAWTSRLNQVWTRCFKRAIRADQGMSMYVHSPPPRGIKYDYAF